MEEKKEPKRRKINESVPIDTEMKQARKKSSKRDRSSSAEKVSYFITNFDFISSILEEEVQELRELGENFNLQRNL
jgi:hypothetical protein